MKYVIFSLLFVVAANAASIKYTYNKKAGDLFYSTEALRTKTDQTDKTCKNVVAPTKGYSYASMVKGLPVGADSAIEIDNINSEITYRGKWNSTKGVPVIDSALFASLAFSFLQKYIPISLNPTEVLCVLPISKECFSREVIVNGKETIESSFTAAGITIGRKIYGMPIFNSYATIVFDAVSKKVVFMKLEKWAPIPKRVLINLNKFNKNDIKVKVESRWSEVQKGAFIDSGIVEIQEIIPGFNITPTGLRSAVAHCGKMRNLKDPSDTLPAQEALIDEF